MKIKYFWMYVLGALALTAVFLLRLKYGNAANTAIASFSLTSTIIFGVYYIQNTFARKAEKNKRS
jgi:hypothetical protein